MGTPYLREIKVGRIFLIWPDIVKFIAMKLNFLAVLETVLFVKLGGNESYEVTKRWVGSDNGHQG